MKEEIEIKKKDLRSIFCAAIRNYYGEVNLCVDPKTYTLLRDRRDEDITDNLYDTCDKDNIGNSLINYRLSLGWRILNMCDTNLFTVNTDTNKIEYKYECYRTNHFEVIPIIKDDNGEEKVLDELRLSVKKSILNKLYGKLSLYVYATNQAIDYINTIDETTDVKNRIYHIKYVLYSDDGSHKITMLNRVMKLTDISFEMYYDKSDAAMIRLDFHYFN